MCVVCRCRLCVLKVASFVFECVFTIILGKKKKAKMYLNVTHYGIKIYVNGCYSKRYTHI